MPVEWKWYDQEQQVVVFMIRDPWLLEEFIVTDEQVGNMVRQMDWIVDGIIDFSQASTVPQNVISGMVKVAKRGHSKPNQGTSVVVTSSSMIKTFVKVGIRMLPPGQLFLAKNVDQALQVITNLQADRAHNDNQQATNAQQKQKSVFNHVVSRHHGP